MQVKRSLDENIYKFDVTDYEDDENIDHHTIADLCYHYFPKYRSQLNVLVKRRIKKNPENPYLLDIDTSEIKDMNNLFDGYKDIKILNLYTWNTSKVTNMYGIFRDCRSLTKLNISNWNTSNVRDMSEMFKGCELLKELDLSNFNTYSVINLENIFYNCKLLIKLDISSFVINYEMVNMIDMFGACKSLKKLYVKDYRIKQRLNKKLRKTLLSENVNMNFNFDVTDYEDDENIIDNQTIYNITKLDNFYNVIDNIKSFDIRHGIKQILLPELQITIKGDLRFHYYLSSIEKTPDLKKLENILELTDVSEFTVELHFEFNERFFETYYHLDRDDTIKAAELLKYFVSTKDLKEYNMVQYITSYDAILSINNYNKNKTITIQEGFNNMMDFLNEYIEYLKEYDRTH